MARSPASQVAGYYDVVRQKTGGPGLVSPRGRRAVYTRRRHAQQLIEYGTSELVGLDLDDPDQLKEWVQVLKDCIDWLDADDWHRYRVWSLPHVMSKLPEYLDRLRSTPDLSGDGEACLIDDSMMGLPTFNG